MLFNAEIDCAVDYTLTVTNEVNPLYCTELKSSLRSF